jgi:hypothetical protein
MGAWYNEHKEPVPAGKGDSTHGRCLMDVSNFLILLEL